MKYRREIDGLRAVAVLPVIFFHAGLLGTSGGYIGVDVFFVISGFLITSIIAEELRQGRFSIVRFYERRARRILPALSAVLLATSLAAFMLLPPTMLREYAQSLVSVVVFLSNVHFYSSLDYFSADSDENPLLHTWSLAVEEQYYVFFPVLLMLFWRFGKGMVWGLLLALLIASFSLAQYLTSAQAENASFYLIFSRAWELLAGVLVAFLRMERRSIDVRYKNALSTIGLVLIGWAVWWFDEHTPFPSFYTLVPVCGAMLVIAFADSETRVGKLLSVRPVVLVGLMSYSLYLWHQPLFAFLRIKTIGEPSALIFILAIALVFGLAALSYTYVESPFRKKEGFTRKQIFQLSSATMVAFFALGMAGHLYDGYPGRFGDNTYWDSVSHSPKRSDCHTRGADYLKPTEACRFFGDHQSWATFGDSHTVEPAYALARMLEPEGDGVVQLSFSACPPSLLFEVKQSGCSSWIRESLAFLEAEESIQNVLVGFRYSAFLYGDQLDHYPDIPMEDPIEEFSDVDGIEDVRLAYWQSFNEILRRLTAAGKKVYVLYPVPELPVHITKAITPYTIFEDRPSLDLDRTTPASYYLARNEFIISKLDTLPYGQQLRAVKPYDVFCKDGYCPAVLNDHALYFDDDHLSVAGAEMLITASGMLRQ